MSSKNERAVSNLTTKEGAPAKVISKEYQLRRAVMACMLWEDSFYENGKDIAKRIEELVAQVNPEIVAAMAVEAREQYKLRHVPLWLVRMLAKTKYPVADVLARIIQRPDEITEFVALYWKDGKQPLSAQVKKGLAKAFTKFNEYSFAKYNKDSVIRLRDVLFLCHAKPLDGRKGYTKGKRKNEIELNENEILFKKIVDNNLTVPDTWEVELSAGKDKRATWERLMKQDKLGALALLRNLRNMQEVGVDMDIIKAALISMKVDRVLPFRFISAARFAPKLEPQLEQVMFKCLNGLTKFTGKTKLLVDVSRSMDKVISAKTDMRRIDVACGLAILLRELCQDVDIYTFSRETILIPARRGFALRDAIITSQAHRDTYLGAAVNEVNKEHYDRIIVITDEQSRDKVPDCKNYGYVINVSVEKAGVGYYKWLHVDGWSEAVVGFIQEFEKLNN